MLLEYQRHKHQAAWYRLCYKYNPIRHSSAGRNAKSRSLQALSPRVLQLSFSAGKSAALLEAYPRRNSGTDLRQIVKMDTCYTGKWLYGMGSVKSGPGWMPSKYFTWFCIYSTRGKYQYTQWCRPIWLNYWLSHATSKCKLCLPMWGF